MNRICRGIWYNLNFVPPTNFCQKVGTWPHSSGSGDWFPCQSILLLNKSYSLDHWRILSCINFHLISLNMQTFILVLPHYYMHSNSIKPSTLQMNISVEKSLMPPPELFHFELNHDFCNFCNSSRCDTVVWFLTSWLTVSRQILVLFVCLLLFVLDPIKSMELSCSLTRVKMQTSHCHPLSEDPTPVNAL